VDVKALGSRDEVTASGGFADPNLPADYAPFGIANIGGNLVVTFAKQDAARQNDGHYLICYGDTLANVNLNELRKAHTESGALATVTVYPMHSPFGIVSFDESNRVAAFAEKPVLPYWINIGYLICEPEALRHIQPGSDMPQFLSSLARSRELAVFKHDGKHLTVNTEKDRAEAEAQAIEFFTLIES